MRRPRLYLWRSDSTSPELFQNRCLISVADCVILPSAERPLQRYLGINLDIGHYLAGTNQSPLPLIEKHRDRIVSLHLKDRKLNNGPNVPFGQGDTPAAQVLQYMKKNRLTFPADIELEYKVPDDSDAVREVAKCVEFCKRALA